MPKTPFLGFTIAELLIALLILGEIATFTIPKVIGVQQRSTYNATTKELVSMVAGAFQIYRFKNSITANTGIKDLTPYMNYLAIDTASTIDDAYSRSTMNCNDADGRCLKFANGAYLEYWPVDVYGTTQSNYAVGFLIDPDGKVTDGTTNGPGKGIYFEIYANGRITSYGNLSANTYINGGGPVAADPTLDPPWFSW